MTTPSRTDNKFTPHKCLKCKETAGWVYVAGPHRDGWPSQMAPCPNRRDARATNFYAERRAAYGPGVEG